MPHFGPANSNSTCQPIRSRLDLRIFAEPGAAVWAVLRQRQRRHRLRLPGAVRDRGGKDIFVHVSALNRAGISELAEGQRVAVDMVEGGKGPEAVSIRLV